MFNVINNLSDSQKIVPIASLVGAAVTITSFSYLSGVFLFACVASVAISSVHNYIESQKNQSIQSSLHRKSVFNLKKLGFETKKLTEKFDSIKSEFDAYDGDEQADPQVLLQKLKNLNLKLQGLKKEVNDSFWKESLRSLTNKIVHLEALIEGDLALLSRDIMEAKKKDLFSRFLEVEKELNQNSVEPLSDSFKNKALQLIQDAQGTPFVGRAICLKQRLG